MRFKLLVLALVINGAISELVRHSTVAVSPNGGTVIRRAVRSVTDSLVQAHLWEDTAVAPGSSKMKTEVAATVSSKIELKFANRLRKFEHYAGNIGFGIPTSLWAKHRPLREVPKTQGFAHIVPGHTMGHSHQFSNSDDYYAEYSKAYYAITMKKGGWDCLRHYEIMLAGTVPYFLNLSSIPARVMTEFPKEIVSQAMHISGVPLDTSLVQHSSSIGTYGMALGKSFDHKLYEDIRQKMLAHVEEHLLTKTMAAKVVPQSPRARIRMHSSCRQTGYTQAFLTIGLLEAGHQVCNPEYPADELFDDYTGGANRLYGSGFTYSRTLNRSEVNYHCDENNGGAEKWDYYILAADCNQGYPRPYPDVVKNSKKVIAVNGNDAGRGPPMNSAPVEAEELYVRENPSSFSDSFRSPKAASKQRRREYRSGSHRQRRRDNDVTDKDDVDRY